MVHQELEQQNLHLRSRLNKKMEEKKIKTEEKENKIVETKLEKNKEKLTAAVRGLSMPISPKYSYSICRFIRNKNPDESIKWLEEVVLMKKAVPMNNREVPHKRGNIMAGRYPITAAREFIKLLKQLKANASVGNIENLIISSAIANRASRPYRRGGKRAKRTNIYLEVRDKNKRGKK